MKTERQIKDRLKLLIEYLNWLPEREDTVDEHKRIRARICELKLILEVK